MWVPPSVRISEKITRAPSVPKYVLLSFQMLRRNGLQLAKLLPRLSALYGLLLVEMLRRDGLQLAKLLPRLSALYGLLLVEMLRRLWEDSKKSQTNLRV